jgi:broad specificity phosphatase PhoE
MILLIRHGKSEHNRDNFYAGCKIDTELTEEGRKEAKEIGKKLCRDGCFDVIICSRLKRSQQTAIIINQYQKEKYGKEAKIISTELMNEVDVGLISGMKPEQAKEKHPEEYRKELSVVIDDWGFAQGENPKRLEERYKSLKELLGTFKNKKVLVVGHARFNRFIVEKLTGKRKENFDHNDIIQFKIKEKK